ncbi:ImmA/IrrE family metallo-endopeptidase [Sphaerochaeta globosa]|uniref:IrrE N-terminal-like domain-containing protein n=1 Tax=Sphaerochaeta globosa (strain ATCC BAA-1886 / DSM 22777 / Buddy) TaxID=158189 RepID=F0RRN6_SPHGB|nr:ImmA/IrrE family metallo-endopeptidase [Sphaerochaeta globosa]ADY14295.1 protein of unknown function DUF955 [Sphaerochaeta globosa str. Buddy]
MDKMKLRTYAEQARHRWGKDSTSPLDIFAIVSQIDTATLVLFPFGENISGICVKSPTSAVLAINSTQTLGRQRFSLAHEMYHYCYDKTNTTNICPTQIDSGDIEERNADRFASYLLIPPLALNERIAKLRNGSNRNLTTKDIVDLEQYFQVSRKAILFRLREEKLLSQEASKSMEQNVKITASAFGYDLALYEPRPVERQKTTLGYYIEKAEQLLSDNKISTGKYEEYLLDAFRADIVFGPETEDEYVD